MTQHKQSNRTRESAPKLEADKTLSEAELDQVSGGTDPAPAMPATSNVMKTKHDTVKNSISNIR
jgi:bacteriocin-like protein